MRINSPGFYVLSEKDYHSDPCPRPSLTQSIVKILLDRSPMHAWHAHPRLNPGYEPDEDRKFDLGNVAHALLLGRGKEIVPLNFDDYRTKAARESRDMMLASGKLPVLGKILERAHEMREAAEKQLGGPPVGLPEVTIAWEDTKIWFRSKIDLLSTDNRDVWDYKTTSQALNSEALQSKMINDGWHIQAAMHEKGLNFLKPDDAGRRRHFFLVQEAYRPYALYTCQLSEGPLELGRLRLATAESIWADCLKANRWPGPSRNVNLLEMPAWAARQYEGLNGGSSHVES